MKKVIVIMLALLCVAALTDESVKFKKLFDSFEAQVRKHIKTGQITLPTLGKFIFNTVSNSYIYESATSTNEEIVLVIWGNDTLQMHYASGAKSFYPHGSGAIHLGNGTANDWDIVYYHTLSQHCGRSSKDHIVPISTDTLKADRLPQPKIYERKTKPGISEYGLIAEDCPPELIKYDQDNQPMLQTNALIAYLCGVVRIQEDRIKKLEQGR